MELGARDRLLRMVPERDVVDHRVERGNPGLRPEVPPISACMRS
jgi:hypothetical protein